MTTVRGIRDGNGREGAGERTGERTGRKKGQNERADGGKDLTACLLVFFKCLNLRRELARRRNRADWRDGMVME